MKNFPNLKANRLFEIVPPYLIHVENECKEFALRVVGGEVGLVEQGGRVEGKHDARVDRVRHR